MDAKSGMSSREQSGVWEQRRERIVYTEGASGGVESSTSTTFLGSMQLTRAAQDNSRPSQQEASLVAVSPGIVARRDSSPSKADGPADGSTSQRRALATAVVRPASGRGNLQFRQHKQQSQQYYDNNRGNNNSNGTRISNNNNKVRLLIAPAAGASIATTNAKPSAECGSESQQMARAISTGQQANGYANNRSQLHSNRPKNYHHYDYYTDYSEPTSSIQADACNNRQRTTTRHYEENILLFATEHSPPTSKQPENGQQQDQRQARAQMRPAPSSRRPQQPQVAAEQQPAGRPAHGQRLASPTGKFVNYYPSWRESPQSPPSSHYQRHSFHVPLHQQQAGGSKRSLRNSRQSRYGFVAPAERLAGRQERDPDSNSNSNSNVAIAATSQRPPSRSFSQPFKSKTIAHLPEMVKLTSEACEPSPIMMLDDDDVMLTNSPSTTQYEDFYAPGRRQFMQSEGDLLRAHHVELRADDGFDNPFKPGTELSWEADLMVRLMKRGYPLSELPALVQSAKQVAGKAERSAQLAPSRSAHQLRQPRGGDSWRQSTEDLNSARRVWASSLNRAKSMPRGFCPVADDADSIDELILSIEREFSDLLQTSEQQVSEGNVVGQRELSGANEASPTGGATGRRLATSKTDQSRKQLSGSPKRIAREKSRKSSADLIGSIRRTSGDVIAGRRLTTSNKGNSSKGNSNEPDLIRCNEANSDMKITKTKTKCCLIQ